MPHLPPRLLQEALRRHPVERRQHPVDERPVPRLLDLAELQVLLLHPPDHDVVDVLEVPVPSADELAVLQLLVAHHGQERLRQVVVEVRVEPDEDVVERRDVRVLRSLEGHLPRARG